MLSQVGVQGPEEPHRFLDSTGKGTASQPREWSHGILVAVSLSPLTFGSWGAHLSFLPWGARNGSISCRETRLVSDKGSPWSLEVKGFVSRRTGRERYSWDPQEEKRVRNLSDFQPFKC